MTQAEIDNLFAPPTQDSFVLPSDSIFICYGDDPWHVSLCKGITRDGEELIFVPLFSDQDAAREYARLHEPAAEVLQLGKGDAVYLLAKMFVSGERFVALDPYQMGYHFKTYSIPQFAEMLMG